MKSSTCILVILLMNIGLFKAEESVLDKIKSGIKMAGNLFGLDMASGVAQLVSSAFNGNSEKRDDESNGLFAMIVKMLSLDSSKIGAIVLNAIIFLAQMINTSLAPKNAASVDSEPRKIRDGSPFEWILENQSEQFRNLLEFAKDENLTQKVVEAIKESSGRSDSSCVQQLICRLEPIVKSMQRALIEKDVSEKPANKNVLFRYLPEFKEFYEHSDYCKQRHKECRLLE